MKTQELTGWGRFPREQCRVVDGGSVAAVARILAKGTPLIARGGGRAYGDASLNPELTLDMRRLDRLLAFDPLAGVLTCEAGLSLATLIDLMLPRGWFPLVTPGTQFVTVGGMIAADVHGKNHHVDGSFCDHLLWIDLAVGDGNVVRCSSTEEPMLFAATCGGMGLTGVILRAAFRLLPVRTAKMRQTTVRTSNLAATMSALEDGLAAQYSVAWIDCLARGAAAGRSVVIFGDHAEPEELKAADQRTPLRRTAQRGKTVPMDFPRFALSGPAVRAFNELYYRTHPADQRIADLISYFYPLDAIGRWNRIYGHRGFFQYQCVLPMDSSGPGLDMLLRAIADANTGSFLAVLKRMGRQSFGLLSFPMPGYTLALDFPATPGAFALAQLMDAIVLDHGGRLYLAKDARAPAAVVAAGYPRLGEFRRLRQQWGLTERFNSAMARRLDL